LVSPQVAQAKNTLRKVNREREGNFLNMSENCHKSQTITFFSTFSNMKITVFKLSGKITVLCIRGCLHWRSNAICLRVTVGNVLESHTYALCAR